MSLPPGLKPFKTIRVCSFGPLEFTELETHLINTSHFQALRNVKQLGLVHYVYPNAIYTRFDHCLAVCHFSSEWLNQIHRHQPEIEWYDEWYCLVRIAALNHDLAHLCWSHVFDDFLRLSPTGTQVKTEMRTHESRGVLLLKYLLSRAPKQLTSGIVDNDETFEVIADIIRGLKSETPDQENLTSSNRFVTNAKGKRIPIPKWLFEVVANKHTELCADKLVYLTMDSASVGSPIDLEMSRIFSHTRVCPQTGHLIWSQKVAHNLARVFAVRRQMYARVYLAAEVMKYDLLVMDLFEVLFRVFELHKLLNDYDTNDHKWRLLLHDSMVWSLFQQVLFHPEWTKPVSAADRAELLRIWNLWSDAGKICVVQDYETKKIEKLEEGETIVRETSTVSPQSNSNSSNGVTDFASLSLGDSKEQQILQQSHPNDTSPSESKKYILKTMHATYSYANNSFHPADKIRIYRDANNLHDTYLLRDAPAFQLLDIDIHAKPIRRTVVYQIPLEE